MKYTLHFLKKYSLALSLDKAWRCFVLMASLLIVHAPIYSQTSAKSEPIDIRANLKKQLDEQLKKQGQEPSKHASSMASASSSAMASASASAVTPTSSKASASANANTNVNANDKAKEKIASDDEVAIRIAEKLAEIRKQKEMQGKSKKSEEGEWKTVGNGRYMITPSRKKGGEDVRHVSAPMRETVVSQAKWPDKSLKNINAHAISDWSYEGDNGPEFWGRNPAYAQCALGERQSPIDLRDGFKVDLDALGWDYGSTQFEVVDTGKTVQVNFATGNSLNVSGQIFELKQLHFHRPSEERINGKAFEMVAHLVHKSKEGKWAKVAVLMQVGSPNSVVQQFWNNLPLEKQMPMKSMKSVNVLDLIPSSRDYYTFMGSFTTPPCTEGVLWIVLKQPVEISAEQLHIFSRLYPMNARPIQRSFGRIIKESQ